MQSDCPAPGLPFASAIPKFRIRRPHTQRFILVIRYDGEDGLDIAIAKNLFNVIPHVPIHRRADVVKSQKILGLHSCLAIPLYGLPQQRAFPRAGARVGVETTMRAYLSR